MTIIFISYFGEVMIFVTFALRLKMVAVAQLVRASDCDSEGRGFEPLQLPKSPRNFGGFLFSALFLKMIKYISYADAFDFYLG